MSNYQNTKKITTNENSYIVNELNRDRYFKQDIIITIDNFTVMI